MGESECLKAAFQAIPLTLARVSSLKPMALARIIRQQAVMATENRQIKRKIKEYEKSDGHKRPGLAIFSYFYVSFYAARASFASFLMDKKNQNNNNMRNRIFLFSLILFLGIGLPSCNLFPDPEPPDYQGELESLLPATQYQIAYFSGTDHGRFQLQWTQQLAGVRSDNGAVDIYNMQGRTLNTSWNLYYKYIYPNLYGIALNADEVESKSYRAISKILLALNLGMMTDAWGDIPNTSALGYISGYYPDYDPQSDIYPYLLDLIDTALADLAEGISSDVVKPGADHDLIYGGDLQRWTRAAHTLRLRYLLRVAHQANEYDMLIPYFQAGNLFSGNQDDLEYSFPGANQENPHYYFENTIRHTRMGKYFVDRLLATQDPRLPVFVKKSTETNQYVGSAPGENNFNASFIGSAMASQRSPVTLISYAELKFIEAEVYQRTGQQALADQAFELAVKASLQKYDVSNPAWEAEHAEIENVSLQQIIEAKYVALFLNPEVFSDYRRTGFPQLIPYQGAEVQQIPRRFIYPEDETMYNSIQIPQDVTIFDRVWWDVER